jgi:hypothetical protein
MAYGKQGGKAPAPVAKPIMGKKNGGKVVGGGGVAKPMANKTFKGNARKGK